MSLVKLLGAVDGIISIKTHFKGAFAFSAFLDLAFLFIEENFHDVQKGYGSIIISIYYQILVVYPSNNDMLDIWPNLLCNNYKAVFFLDGNFFVFDIYFIFPKNS